MTIPNTARPALLGGPRAITEDHAAANHWPILTEEDEQAVLRVIRDGNISTHPVIREYENDFAAYFGRRHAMAMSNGTAALISAFFTLDLQPGDEVIVPSATFWASILPMLWFGCVPVFAESESERLGLDPEDVESKITERTKAIVAVHLWGMPCKMTELLDIARRHGLRVIEDASHAHGAIWRGRKCGSLGDIAAFSLQGSKLAPAGEGGMMICDSYEYYERALLLGDIFRIMELETDARRYAWTTFGIKTRIAPMSAALGKAQLSRLDEYNGRRNENIRYLSGRLEDLGFDTFQGPPHVERVYFDFLVRPRPGEVPLSVPILIEALGAEGCEAAPPRFPLVHQQPFFTEGHYRKIARLPETVTPPVYRADSLPRTERLQASLIRLPTFATANRTILDQYAAAFEKVVAHAEEIAKTGSD